MPSTLHRSLQPQIDNQRKNIQGLSEISCLIDRQIGVMAGPFRLVDSVKNYKPIVRKTVYVTRTRNIHTQVVDAVVSGIRLMRDAGRPDIEIKDLRDWGVRADPATEYQSLDWYQSQSALPMNHGFGPQIDTGKVLHLAMAEPWQEKAPHFEAMIVDRDLNTRQVRSDGKYDFINFVFGSTYPEFGFVVSPIRIVNDINMRRYNVNREFLLRIMRKLAAHEFGHILGLVHRNHNFEDSLGRHCNGEKGPCIMRQGLSLDVWIRQHLEEIEANQEICSDCQKELQEKALTLDHT